MKYISLFTGIGCADVAWMPLDWEPLAFSEIDPFASAVLSARFPGVPNVGDITAHDWSAYRGRCDLVIGGSPCFAAGTLVLTSDGLKPISDVREGDQVLTHQHRYRRVLRTGSKVAQVAWITGQGNPGTVVTAEHPYWAMPMRMEYQNKKTGFKRVFSDPEWTPARSMPGNFWAMPASHPESSMPPIVPEGNEKVDWECNGHFFWLLGAYLGDGWVQLQGNRRGTMIICDGKHHGRKIAEVAARCGLHCGVTEERTTIRYVFSSKALVKWVLRHFGHGAADKSLPAWLYGLEPSLRRSLFAGYQWADGHKSVSGVKTTSVGRKLSLGMRLLGSSLGLHISTVTNVPRRRECVIEGRVVRENPYYVNSYNLASRSAFFKDGNLWMKVKRYEPLGLEVPVFNLEVEEDNSYTADGFFVHNCQAFSVAGLRKSLSDRRGNLTLAFVEACHAIDPGIIVWENVPGVQSTPDNAFGCFLAGLVGASEPLSSGHRRGRWPDAGMVIGPQRAAAWGLLDSQHFGVPQRRKRLFLVAVALSHPAFAPGKTPNCAAVLFNPPGLRRHPSAGGAAGEEVVGALASRATGGGGLGTDLECSGGLQPVPTLMASGAGTERPAGMPCEAEYCVPMADGLPAVSGTLGGGSGARGYNNGLDLAGAFIPVPVPPDTARCLSTRVDRQNDTQETMVVQAMPTEVIPAVTAKWSKGCGGPAGDETQNLVAYPLLEINKRNSPGCAKAKAGHGIGNPGDPMFTLQASAQHGVAVGAPDPQEKPNGEAVPLDMRNAQREQHPRHHTPGDGVSGREGDPAFSVTAGGAVQAVAFSSKDSGADEGEVAPTLRAMNHDASHVNGGGQVAIAVRLAHTAANGCGFSEGIAHTLDSTGAPEAVAYQSEDIAVATVMGAVTHTLAAEGADASEDGTGRGTPVVAVHQNQSGELRTGAVANTLNTNGNATGRNSPLVATGLAVRRLTPRECERLQGLPDDWTLIPYGRPRKVKDLAEMAAYWGVSEEDARTLAADSLRYKATGNGMAVPVIWWIGRRIEWVLEQLAAWDGRWEDDA